jgi:hypothetical protein
MGTMITRLRVRDYYDWRQAFDEGLHHRAAAGLTNERIYREINDGNSLVLVMEAADMAMAREFAASDARRAGILKGDVLGSPIDCFAD